MEKVNVGYYKINEKVVEPKIATTFSACFDLSYCADHTNEIHGYDDLNRKVLKTLDIFKNLIIYPNERLLVPTGLIFDIPVGYSMRIHSRSSTAYKLGLMLANSEGIVDADYKEECYLLLTNITSLNIILENNTRLCQAEIVPVIPVSFTKLNEAPGRISERNGGFGSTGT